MFTLVERGWIIFGVCGDPEGGIILSTTLTRLGEREESCTERGSDYLLQRTTNEDAGLDAVIRGDGEQRAVGRLVKSCRDDDESVPSFG